MTRTYSQNRQKAHAALKDASLREFPVGERRVAAQAAVAFALLEMAFQIGRVADYMSITAAGPPEER